MSHVATVAGVRRRSRALPWLLTGVVVLGAGVAALLLIQPDAFRAESAASAQAPALPSAAAAAALPSAAVAAALPSALPSLATAPSAPPSTQPTGPAPAFRPSGRRSTPVAAETQAETPPEPVAEPAPAEPPAAEPPAAEPPGAPAPTPPRPNLGF